MSDEALSDLLRPVRERNRGKLLERLARVRAAIAADAGPRLPAEELRADLHALVGALGTYGWPHGSQLLTEIQAVATAGGSAAEFLPALDRLVAEVRGPLP
jgi:hypothetical protein